MKAHEIVNTKAFQEWRNYVIGNKLISKETIIVVEKMVYDLVQEVTKPSQAEGRIIRKGKK